MLKLMTTITKTPTNQQMIQRLETAMAAMFADVLRRGFHGTAGIEVGVQDGTIQNIRRRVERIER
jgi:hypothetical protein